MERMAYTNEIGILIIESNDCAAPDGGAEHLVMFRLDCGNSLFSLFDLLSRNFILIYQ